MFNNLNAEQARYKHTDRYVAQILGISRAAYNIKKNRGNFSDKQIKILCDLYKKSFEYLFEE